MTGRQLIPALGLVATIAAAGYAVAQLSAQSAGSPADFRNAVTAEVRDAQGQIVLRGQFEFEPEEDEDEIERRARLEPTGVDADATGDAEVEFAKTTPSAQEVEFSFARVTPGATFTAVVDGIDVATVKSDARGRAEVELDVPLTGKTP